MTFALALLEIDLGGLSADSFFIGAKLLDEPLLVLSRGFLGVKSAVGESDIAISPSSIVVVGNVLVVDLWILLSTALD